MPYGKNSIKSRPQNNFFFYSPNNSDFVLIRTQGTFYRENEILLGMSWSRSINFSILVCFKFSFFSEAKTLIVKGCVILSLLCNGLKAPKS